MGKLKARWLQILTHVGALLPLAWLLWETWQGQLIVDPVKEITTRTGKTALILLILSLACTPINTILGFKQVLRLRQGRLANDGLQQLPFGRCDVALVQQDMSDVVVGFCLADGLHKVRHGGVDPARPGECDGERVTVVC